MRKTSHDGVDTSSITSGVENEVRKLAAGVVKIKKSSIKRKVQSFSHESDDGVVEPLLQKEKPESMIQSAKYLLSKTKTDIKSDKIDDKDKLLSEGKFEDSPVIKVVSTNSTINTSFSGQQEKMPNTMHNHMNTNVFCTSDGSKNTVTAKSQVLVELDGSKPNSYNSSSLIFTTAKIHSDGNTKHMEPVQMTPVPILSTAEGNIVKANIRDSENNDSGKSVTSDYDSLKLISSAPASNSVQTVPTSYSSTFSSNTSHSESDKFKTNDLSTSKLSQTIASTSKMQDTNIKNEKVLTSKLDSQYNQKDLRNNEQKCEQSSVQTLNGNPDINKNIQSILCVLQSQDSGKPILNIKETVKVRNKNENRDTSKDSNVQKKVLEDTKDNSKIKSICSQSNISEQTANITVPVSGIDKQIAHKQGKSEINVELTKKVSALTSFDKPVAKGSVIELSKKTDNADTVPVKVDSKDTFNAKFSDVNKKKEPLDKHLNVSDTASIAALTKGSLIPTTSTKTITKSKMSDFTPAKGNTKLSEKSTQNDKSEIMTKSINYQAAEITKSPIVPNTTSINVPIIVPKPITVPASQNTVSVMSSTSKKPLSSKASTGNTGKITGTGTTHISRSTNNIKTSSTISRPETSGTLKAKEAIATSSKTSQQELIKPSNSSTKSSSVKTKSQPTASSKSSISTAKSSDTPKTTMNATELKSKPTTKSSANTSKEVKKDKVK